MKTTVSCSTCDTSYTTSLRMALVVNGPRCLVCGAPADLIQRASSDERHGRFARTTDGRAIAPADA